MSHTVFLKGLWGGLTRQRAAQDLQPHAQRAVPALRDDPDVASQHGLGEPVHDRSVFVVVSEEQLNETGETGGRRFSGGARRRRRRLRSTHPVCVSVVNGGPFSAVITEGQEVGCHEVAPEMSQQKIRMWSLLLR